MRRHSSERISLANPLTVPLLLITTGAFSFIIYQNFVSEEPCEVPALTALFSFAAIVASLFVVRWAKKLEQLRFVTISPISPLLVLLFILFKVYVILLLLRHGGTQEVDARFDAYGSSVIVMFATALGPLFFPISFFATRIKMLRLAVFLIFLASALSTLVLAPSKSLVISTFFSILSYFFFKRKISGMDFSINLMSFWSFLIIGFLAIMQILMLVFIFSSSLSDWAAVFLNRIYFNFDSAIYACRVGAGAHAPNNFFVYTILPILKRLDPSYYDLDFYNVSQWLLYEAFGITRFGRMGYPNDNLFIGLFFGGFEYFSIFVFLIIFLLSDLFFSRSIAHSIRSGRISPLRLAVLLYFPLIFQSAQEFFGFLLVLGTFLSIHVCSNFRVKPSANRRILRPSKD